jgi:hypothetical protein
MLFDSKYQKLHYRHRVEKLFARLKPMRGIATRFDKLRVMDEGIVKLGLLGEGVPSACFQPPFFHAISISGDVAHVQA